MAALQVALDALRAQLALVERELVPRLEADDGIALDLEFDTALLAAETAVGVHHLVGLDAVVPPTRRCAVEVRAVLGDQCLVGNRWDGHQPKPPTRPHCASATWVRRHVGHVF